MSEDRRLIRSGRSNSTSTIVRNFVHPVHRDQVFLNRIVEILGLIVLVFKETDRRSFITIRDANGQ